MQQFRELYLYLQLGLLLRKRKEGKQEGDSRNFHFLSESLRITPVYVREYVAGDVPIRRAGPEWDLKGAPKCGPTVHLHLRDRGEFTSHSEPSNRSNPPS